MAPRTFHPFPKLPIELRRMIWKVTFPGPRRIAPELTQRLCEAFRFNGSGAIYDLIAVKVCRESRALALESHEYHASLGGYVNFKLDTFYFGMQQFHKFQRIDVRAPCDRMEKVIWGYTTLPFQASLHFMMLVNSGLRKFTNIKDLKLELWPHYKAGQSGQTGYDSLDVWQGMADSTLDRFAAKEVIRGYAWIRPAFSIEIKMMGPEFEVTMEGRLYNLGFLG
jgi:hypothetical protein